MSDWTMGQSRTTAPNTNQTSSMSDWTMGQSRTTVPKCRVIEGIPPRPSHRRNSHPYPTHSQPEALAVSTCATLLQSCPSQPSSKECRADEVGDTCAQSLQPRAPETTPRCAREEHEGMLRSVEPECVLVGIVTLQSRNRFSFRDKFLQADMKSENHCRIFPWQE